MINMEFFIVIYLQNHVLSVIINFTYISSFVGFAPANDPKVIGMVIIYNPKGIYYGGTIAAPVLRDIYDNVLPYLEKQEK